MPAGYASPSSRYILPQFEERTSYGMKRLDPYTKLFEDRIIFLGVQVDDASADDVIAQLIVLESQDPDRDILMYINSPGGSFTAMAAIYDTMQYIRPDVQTFVIGQAASAAAVLLSAGAKGKRFALPERADPDPPAGPRGRHGRTGVRHRDPGQRGAAHAHLARGDLGQALGPHPRAGPQRHRARQDPVRRRRPRSTASSTRSSPRARAPSRTDLAGARPRPAPSGMPPAHESGRHTCCARGHGGGRERHTGAVRPIAMKRALLVVPLLFAALLVLPTAPAWACSCASRDRGAGGGPRRRRVARQLSRTSTSRPGCTTLVGGLGAELPVRGRRGLPGDRGIRPPGSGRPRTARPAVWRGWSRGASTSCSPRNAVRQLWAGLCDGTARPRLLGGRRRGRGRPGSRPGGQRVAR